jgi:hypothetical protein
MQEIMVPGGGGGACILAKAHPLNFLVFPKKSLLTKWHHENRQNIQHNDTHQCYNQQNDALEKKDKQVSFCGTQNIRILKLDVHGASSF